MGAPSLFFLILCGIILSCTALLSDHSSRMQQLEDDVARMNPNLRKQAFPEKKHSDEKTPFDPSFFLRTSLDGNTVTNVSCSSDEDPQKIEFSRVLDTGTGVGLPAGAKTYWRGKSAVLDLTVVESKDRRGVYQCRRSGDGNNAGITFIIDRLGMFVRPEVASLGDQVELNHYSYNQPTLRWLKDGKHVPELDGRGKWMFGSVTREDAGFYERYEDGDRQGSQHFYGIVVRGCPPGKFGESCDRQCPACYNGGICHDFLGACVCPPGFEGSSCEVACGEDRFGTNCTDTCDGGKCFSNMFCKPGPYGCSCAPGYRLDYCNYRGCDGLKYGADCTQNCNCRLFQTCNQSTGACTDDHSK